MITLTWLGHAAFRFDTPAGDRIYVDPFLTGNPSCPEGELEPDRVDAILLTHGHHDHVGDAARLARTWACPVIAQVELRGALEGELGGADMTLSLNKGGGKDLLGSRITLTHANHSSSYNGAYTGESCGYVIETPGEPTIYFAGDTNVFGDMELIRRIYAPDVAVLPIGDHFTMGPREAAVAAELVGAAKVIPSHYGTFPLLTGTPAALQAPPPVRCRAGHARRRGDGRVVTGRQRWFGDTGRKVPELALVGTIDVAGALELTTVDDVETLRAAHANGVPVVVHATTVEGVAAALARPEVACVLVEDEALLALDLADLTYG